MAELAYFKGLPGGASDVCPMLATPGQARQLYMMKRTLDLTIAVMCAPFAILIGLVAAIPIALECRASPFFRQERLGRHERPFLLLKLRTMHVSTRQGGSHEVGQSSILKTGRWIRRLKIDELPQLWNVLRGEMSLVGPRPGLPMQQELLEARRAFGIFEMKPGITGVSQIRGIDMSRPWELAKHDALYLVPWRFSYDLSLLLTTAIGGGNGDAAERT